MGQQVAEGDAGELGDRLVQRQQAGGERRRDGLGERGDPEDGLRRHRLAGRAARHAVRPHIGRAVFEDAEHEARHAPARELQLDHRVEVVQRATATHDWRRCEGLTTWGQAGYGPITRTPPSPRSTPSGSAACSG